MPKNRVRVTLKQKQAVDNIISGQFKSVATAMRDAGYSAVSATHPAHALMNRRGVEAYLAKLDELSQRKFNLSLPDKVMETYMDGLDATKVVRICKQTEERPDWLVRKAFADKFSEFFGWSKESSAPTSQNQYNFFSVSQEERDSFNQRFKEFMRKYYQ